MTEGWLLIGPLEPVSEAYTTAKITGLKLAEFYLRCALSFRDANKYFLPVGRNLQIYRIPMLLLPALI